MINVLIAVTVWIVRIPEMKKRKCAVCGEELINTIQARLEHYRLYHELWTPIKEW
jgi:hypothetical protein